MFDGNRSRSRPSMGARLARGDPGASPLSPGHSPPPVNNKFQSRRVLPIIPLFGCGRARKAPSQFGRQAHNYSYFRGGMKVTKPLLFLSHESNRAREGQWVLLQFLPFHTKGSLQIFPTGSTGSTSSLRISFRWTPPSVSCPRRKASKSE